MKRWLTAIDHHLSRLENLLLTSLLAAMILLSLTSMVLRWAGSGISAIDPLLRYGVLWLGLIGGLAATRAGSHVQIGAVARLLPPAAASIVSRVLAALTAAICAIIAEASWRFVMDERAAGTEAFGGVPLWILQVIMPVGFALLCARFLLQAALPADNPASDEATP